MNIFKNLKAWKTTTIGLLLIFASIASVFFQVGTWIDTTIPVCLGIVLLFAPDNIVEIIKKIIDK